MPDQAVWHFHYNLPNTIDTDNWPFTFFAEYEVDGETEITMTAVEEE